jgi:hypothetical protein
MGRGNIHRQMHRHWDNSQGRHAKLIIGQETIENEAGTENDGQDNAIPPILENPKMNGEAIKPMAPT